MEIASVTGSINGELNQMVENLGDILKYALDTEHKYIPLAEEISFTLSYIEIQKVRYRDTFDVIWVVTVPDKQVRVLKLMLQLLIENSLRQSAIQTVFINAFTGNLIMRTRHSC